MRYKNTNVNETKEGFRAYSTTYYPNIPISDGDAFIISRQNERLDLLAFDYYGDRKLWWVIAKANGIRGKIGLNAGETLRIPGNITKIIDDFERINEKNYYINPPDLIIWFFILLFICINNYINHSIPRFLD